MLSPRDRSLLLQSLQPPEGYRLDRAIGTSYSLDLLALLTAPLAFTFYDWEDNEGRPTADPLALLEAVRRHAERITIFCQAGGIRVPRPGQTLLAWIEDSVVEVRAPTPGGIFHPKVWVLRFTAPDLPTSYRFLCLSRNLTFDRSWDTVLVLDGELRDRTRAIARNRPLSEFVAALPGMAVRPTAPAVQSDVGRIADELLRVEFELPEGFDTLEFQPLGHTTTVRRGPFFRPRGLVVVSPFLSADLLRGLAEHNGGACTVVSRPEAFAALPDELLERLQEKFVLAPEADAETDEDEEGPAAESLRGLHAKIYVEDDGRDGWVWTGSANATNAAFHANVELLVGLASTKGKCGTRAFLDGTSDGDGGLRALLVPWNRTEAETDPDTAERERVALVLDQLGREIGALDLVVEAHPHETEDSHQVRVVLRGSPPAVPQQVRIRVWPTSLPEEHGQGCALALGTIATFGAMSTKSLTSLLAVELRWDAGRIHETRRFALRLPCKGFPSNRRERLLLSLLQDREHVLKLLWLLLCSEGLDAEQVIDVAHSGAGTGLGWRSQEGIPLLEAMLRALERDPERLDDVHRLVSDLQRTPEGRQLLPEGLDSIWEPIALARERLRS